VSPPAQSHAASARTITAAKGDGPIASDTKVAVMNMAALKRRLFLISTAVATMMMFAEPAFAGYRGP
jgi:hypothetical protein